MDLDHRRRTNESKRTGRIDFSSPDIMLYLLLGLLLGPLPLIVYFGLSRRSFGGWVLGVVLAAGVLLATMAAHFRMAGLLRSLS